jgi:transcriptional regulator with GAF, ATPase, and Fis domain
LPAELIEPVAAPLLGVTHADATPVEPSSSPKPRRLEEAERRHIEEVLGEMGWTIEGSQGAAAILGIAPSTLRSRMKKLGVKRP